MRKRSEKEDLIKRSYFLELYIERLTSETGGHTINQNLISNLRIENEALKSQVESLRTENFHNKQIISDLCQEISSLRKPTKSREQSKVLPAETSKVKTLSMHTKGKSQTEFSIPNLKKFEMTLRPSLHKRAETTIHPTWKDGAATRGKSNEIGDTVREFPKRKASRKGKTPPKYANINLEDDSQIHDMKSKDNLRKQNSVEQMQRVKPSVPLLDITYTQKGRGGPNGTKTFSFPKERKEVPPLQSKNRSRELSVNRPGTTSAFASSRGIVKERTLSNDSLYQPKELKMHSVRHNPSVFQDIGENDHYSVLLKDGGDFSHRQSTEKIIMSSIGQGSPMQMNESYFEILLENKRMEQKLKEAELKLLEAEIHVVELAKERDKFQNAFDYLVGTTQASRLMRPFIVSLSSEKEQAFKAHSSYGKNQSPIVISDQMNYSISLESFVDKQGELNYTSIPKVLNTAQSDKEMANDRSVFFSSDPKDQTIRKNSLILQ
eukprot:TRINITY_DN6914_c0_g1_i6.p1 TRINITY_DN6914_c0_g1~~TRINITY_DN6914_c0_g1_i6.p1  ORF type:complete len:492 (+),score=107.14 TRINITY_DN6914_c0_g1_i6:822-2297(+)